MLENLFELVKEYGQQHVVANPDVPNEHNDAVMAEASQSVAGTLQNALANGQMEDVQNLFANGGDAMSNPLAQNMQGSFIDNITSKLGLNKNVAAGLASTFIPLILNQLVSRTNSTAPQDSGFNLNSLIGSLTGGGNAGNVGGLDIGGLINQFTGGGQANAGQQQGAGGLDSLIKGFFGR